MMAASSGPRKPRARRTLSRGFKSEIGRERGGGGNVQIAGEELGAVGHLRHLPVLGRVLDPGDTDGVDTHDLAVAVRDELLGADAVLARVLAEEGSDLGVTVVDTEDLGPLWPLRRRIKSVGGQRRGEEIRTHRVVGSTRSGRSREQLEVGDALGSVSDLRREQVSDDSSKVELADSRKYRCSRFQCLHHR